jgi:hypothetical protein
MGSARCGTGDTAKFRQSGLIASSSSAHVMAEPPSADAATTVVTAV